LRIDSKPVYRVLAAGIVVPGLGHLLVGRSKTAVLAFALPVALFAIGFALAGQRLFAFSGAFGSDANLFGQILQALPLHLIPECLNFGPALLAWLAVGPENILEPSLRLPVATEHLGLALTAASGYLNVFFATDAGWSRGSEQYYASRSALRPSGVSLRNHPAFSSFLAWLIPGAGYLYEGRRTLGLLVGGSILLLWILGLFFSGFCGVDRSQLYWWWGGAVGARITDAARQRCARAAADHAGPAPHRPRHHPAFGRRPAQSRGRHRCLHARRAAIAASRGARRSA
jgi:hypothetical protein